MIHADSLNEKPGEGSTVSVKEIKDLERRYLSL